MRGTRGFTRLSRQRLGLVLLLMLLFRAYVPVGYMPSAGAPWQLDICPEGLAVGPMVHHHQHGAAPSGAHGHFEHCPFGAVPAVGPSSHTPQAAPAPPPEFAVREDFAPAAYSFSTRRAHRARAPPPATHV